VGRRASGDPEALHNTLKALAFGNTAHVNELALGKRRDGHDVTHLQGRSRMETDFAENAGRVLQPGLFRMADFTRRGVLHLLLGKADLDGVVTVGGDGLDLDHCTGSGLHD